MNELGEGIGTAIEGALIGGAIEPGHGGAASDKSGSAWASASEGTVTCANCGTVFAGNYCPHCGQKAHLHRTLSAIGHDLMHGVLHLDGKLSRTLPLLAFRPGRLTRRYIDGERAGFVSPMSMFLFSIFAMFAVFQIVGIAIPTDLEADGVIATQAQEARANVEAEAQALRDRLATMSPGDPARAATEQELAELEEGLEGLAQIESFGINGTADLTFEGTGIEWIDKGLVKKWQKNPGLMLYKLQANAYKFSWLLIPLSLPFVWLMFAWRRRFKAYDHAVFVTYSLAFMSLLFIALSIAGSLGLASEWGVAIFALAAPLHLYKHLRHTYGLSRFSAIWRFVALLVFIILVIVLFVQALVVLGAF